MRFFKSNQFIYEPAQVAKKQYKKDLRI